MPVPSAPRHCGDCTLCCKVMEIEALAKPAGNWCPHCRPKHGCAIYQERPAECADFNCLWLLNARLGEQWRPSKAKFVLTTSKDGIEVRCDPGFPDAWRREPYATGIRQWAVSGDTHDVTVLIITSRRMILITGEREFDLGIVGVDQRIVRELEDGKVVNVRVVDADE